MKSKSMSPVISTLVVLGIALVVAGITYTWTATYVPQQTKSFQESTDVNALVQKQTAIGLTLENATTTGKLIVANNSSQPLIISQLMVDGNLISIPPVTIPAGGIASIDANISLSAGQIITLITSAGASKTITLTGDTITQYASTPSTSTLSFSDLLNNTNYLNAGATNANITNGEARLSTSLAWQVLKDFNVSNNSGASNTPSIALDSNDNPSIAWYDITLGNWETYYRDWNGTDWVTAAGNLDDSSLNVSNNSDSSTYPSLALDVNGNPSIAWQDNTPGNDEIYYRDWNGTDWVTVAGDLSGLSLNVSNTSGISRTPSLALDVNGNPSIAWRDYSPGNYEIYYRDWNGTDWVTINGNLFDDDLNASNTIGTSAYPSLKLDANGNPSIAWTEVISGITGNEVYYSEWNGIDWTTAKGSGGTAISNYVWIANYGSGTVSKISKTTNTVVANIGTGSSPENVAVDDSYVWATGLIPGPNVISKINKLTNSVEANIPLSGRPISMSVDRDYIWVGICTDCGTGTDGTILKINKSTYVTDTVIPVGGQPKPSAVDNGYLWVPNYNSTSISKINKLDNSVTPIGVGDITTDVALDNTYAWVAGRNGNVFKINKSDNSVTTIPVGGYHYGIAVDNSFAWVTHDSSTTVSKIDKSTNSVVATITVGTNPHGIAVDSMYVWVANSGSNNVSKISKATNTVIATIPVGGSPYSIGSSTGYAFDSFGFGNTNDFNVSNNSAVSEFPSLALDVNGKPSIVWEDNILGNYETYHCLWNGTGWVTAIGALCDTVNPNVSNTAGIDSRYPQLALDSNGLPSIAWQESISGMFDIYYSEWNGSNWAALGSINISNNAGNSQRPSIAVDVNNGFPSIAWQDESPGNPEIYFTDWAAAFSSGNAVESIEVDSVFTHILSATLTASTLKPSGTAISFFLSNDNGTTWAPVTSGIEVPFALTGSQLKWRADLNSTSTKVTPRIYDVNIGYVHEA